MFRPDLDIDPPEDWERDASEYCDRCNTELEYDGYAHPDAPDGFHSYSFCPKCDKD